METSNKQENEQLQSGSGSASSNTETSGSGSASSKNQSLDFNVKDASKRIQELTSEEDIIAFTKGDDRSTVINSAKSRISELNPVKPKVKSESKNSPKVVKEKSPCYTDENGNEYRFKAPRTEVVVDGIRMKIEDAYKKPNVMRKLINGTFRGLVKNSKK